jgi:hypothetical protein
MRIIRLAQVVLLCALAIGRAGGWARPAESGGPRAEYLPVVEERGSTFPYVLQPGSPLYLANFLNTSGCDWFGMAGRAFGRDGNAVIGLSVHLQGGGLNLDVVTGSGPSALGLGSYQIPMSDRPTETTGVYFIQLFSNAHGTLSDMYMIPTFNECSMNLILINFIQVP